MPTFTATLTPYTHTGPAVTLAQAAFAGSLRRVYRVSPNGLGWSTYLPGSGLNAFVTLDPGSGYVIEALAFPFTIPDAAAASPAPLTYSVDGSAPVAGETIFGVGYAGGGVALKHSAPSTLTAAFATGTGTVQASLDAGATWAAVGAGLAVPADTYVRVQVLHADGAAFTASFTFTFS